MTARFVNSIKMAIQNENWYGALSTALMMPDICGRLEFPEDAPKERYLKWYNKWVLDKYIGFLGPNRLKHIFFSGSDCYAFRCAYLHEGSSNIEDQNAREALSRIHFISPPDGKIEHNNQHNNVLQLQVNIFCEDICQSVEEWNIYAKDNVDDLEDKLQHLLRIYDSNNL